MGWQHVPSVAYVAVRRHLLRISLPFLEMSAHSLRTRELVPVPLSSACELQGWPSDASNHPSAASRTLSISSSNVSACVKHLGSLDLSLITTFFGFVNNNFEFHDFTLPIVTPKEPFGKTGQNPCQAILKESDSNPSPSAIAVSRCPCLKATALFTDFVFFVES